MNSNDQTEEIANSALNLIIEKRGYSDKNTIEVLKNTVVECLNQGATIEGVIKQLSHQLSLLTNISFDEWIKHLYPSDFGNIKTLKTMLHRLQIYVPNKIVDKIECINIALMTPNDSYRMLCHVERQFDVDAANVKWGLLAHFAEKGCVFSMLSIAHLLQPLSPSDPIIANNKDIANQLFSYAIYELNTEHNSISKAQFISRFQNMICEAYLKHGHYLLSVASRREEGEKLILWADKHSSQYSRVKRYIKSKKILESH